MACRHCRMGARTSPSLAAILGFPRFSYLSRTRYPLPQTQRFPMRKPILALSLFAGAVALSAATGALSAASNTGASDEPAPQFTGVWVRTGEPMFDPIPGAKEGGP